MVNRVGPSCPTHAAASDIISDKIGSEGDRNE
jgi:hypothetical protein